jgi:NADPH:quinone reductase-like Zn-dependent oxidoreductase
MMAPFVPQRMRTFETSVNQDDLLAVTELIESGKITPVIDWTHPLSRSPRHPLHRAETRPRQGRHHRVRRGPQPPTAR